MLAECDLCRLRAELWDERAEEAAVEGGNASDECVLDVLWAEAAASAGGEALYGDDSVLWSIWELPVNVGWNFVNSSVDLD